ncbi:hypothetical protein P378_03085 [Desulforamulus profundi]|uniref:Uncharacterized protein n=1 Tax=Desulforamulus profundi TaxID=1383067 RepID=A0A2C6MI02_9FIRM|nr:hypothetical protein [Desulforamulus profundi]PHJ39405.1 hypothetical protein P378_03085 [Desulforamulus profundi]
MFLRKVTTKKNGREYVYVKLIESYRMEGKVKQRVLANFGSLDNLTPGKIKSLIASLSKLHNEIETGDNQLTNVDNLVLQMESLQARLARSDIRHVMEKAIRCPKQLDLAQALVIKSAAGENVNLPIQDVCKRTGLCDGTNIQFYHVTKKLGQEEVRQALFHHWLLSSGCDKKSAKTVFIHIVPAVFKGAFYEGFVPEVFLLPEHYRKKLILLLACDEKGTPVEFEYAEGLKHLPQQVELLVQRMKNQARIQAVVLDAENYLSAGSKNYLVAGMMPDDEKHRQDTSYFQGVQVQSHGQDKTKELQAKLARTSAGLEMIKADILLGKLSRESAIRKRAAMVLKDNDCQDMVAYRYDQDSNSFAYEIKEEMVNRKNRSEIITTWGVKGFNTKEGSLPEWVGIHVGRFTEISDQLRIPLINVCAEYHYSPEIISGHILLEVIKSRLQEDNNIADQEVKSGECLGLCI